MSASVRCGSHVGIHALLLRYWAVGFDAVIAKFNNRGTTYGTRDNSWPRRPANLVVRVRNIVTSRIGRKFFDAEPGARRFLNVPGGQDPHRATHKVDRTAFRDELLKPASTGTVGDALEVAARSIPPGLCGSAVMISDGGSTDRHRGRAAVTGRFRCTRFSFDRMAVRSRQISERPATRAFQTFPKGSRALFRN